MVHVQQQLVFPLPGSGIKKRRPRHFAFFLLPARHAGEHVLDVDVHLLDAWFRNVISKRGLARSRTSRSTMRWSSCHSRNCTRSFPWCAASARAARKIDFTERVPGAEGGGPAAEKQQSRTRSSAAGCEGGQFVSFSARSCHEVSTQIHAHRFNVPSQVPTSVFGLLEASTLRTGSPPAAPAPRDLRFPTTRWGHNQNVFAQNVLLRGFPAAASAGVPG